MNLLRSFKSVGGVAVGFMAGIVWVAACGGSAGSNITESIADALMAAIDVSYDNAESGLTSSNVQAAIDELKASIDGLPASSNDDDASEPQEATIILPGITFIPRPGNATSTADGVALVSKDNEVLDFYAPLQLPNGATITELRSNCDNQDMSGGICMATLVRYRTDVLGLTSATILAENIHEQLVFERIDTSITAPVVDNSTYSYFLIATLNDDWVDNLNNIKFYGAKVTYEHE